MFKVETNNPLIHRFDNFITEQECDILSHFMINVCKKDSYKVDVLPWFDGDRISIKKIEDKTVKEILNNHRNKLSDISSSLYKEVLYPILTDIVLWRCGKKMGIHKDNGYDDSGEFINRHYSSVTYINDDYTGGETVIDNYVSIPKKGSIVIFTSDERCLHKVNTIESGTRIVVPIWLTRNIEQIEVI